MAMSKPTMACPKCGETEHIATERRPNGDSTCGSCKYKGATKEFYSMTSKSKQKRLEALGVRGLTRDSLREIIQEWRWFWMNQDLNSEEDRLNYYRRAVGVDANMAHDLIRRIMEASSERA